MGVYRKEPRLLRRRQGRRFPFTSGVVATNAQAQLASGTGTAYDLSAKVAVWAGVGAYSTEVIADGAVAYWRLGEATPGTGTAVDQIGAHDGSYVGSPSSATGALTGVSDHAVAFTGTSQYVTVPNSSGLNFGNGPFSVEAWVNRTTLTGTIQAIVYRGQNSYSIGFGTGNKFFLSKANVAQVVTESGSTTDTGTYHHFVATYAGTGSANAKIYKDGVDVSAYVGDQTIANPGALDLRIAIDNSANNWALLGTIDEVAVYNVVLTPAQVLKHYQFGIGLVAGSASAGAPTPSLAPNAANAGGTGASGGATSKVAPVIQVAAGAGASNAAAASIKPNAGNSAGTGAANAAAASLKPNAANAGGTGAAGSTTSSVAPVIQAATGTGAAGAASSSLAPNAANAGGTGASGSPTSSVAPTSGAASGSGSSGAATDAIAPTAGVAAASGAALDAEGTDAVTADQAAGSGAAYDGSISIAVNAGAGTGTGAASDATVSTTAATNAAAGTSTGTGTSYDPHASLAGSSGSGSGTGTAGGPSSAIAVNTAAGAGSGSALNATVTTVVAGDTDASAGLAAGTGTAYNPTASSGVITPPHVPPFGIAIVPRRRHQRAFAEVAQAYGEAYDASVIWDDDDTAIALLLAAA